MYYNKHLKEVDAQIASLEEQINFGKDLLESYGTQKHIISHLEQLKAQLADLKTERAHILCENPKM